MLAGLPVIYGIDPFSSETEPSHQLGTIGITTDGRKFRYVRNNVTNAAVAGELQQSSVEDTGDQSLLMAAGSIGDRTVTTVGTVTVTANQYADGYIVFTAEGGTGNGLYYKIKSHPAATAAAVTLTLYDALEVAITTATQADLIANPYNLIIQNPTTATGVVVGVAFIALPASAYGWVQTGGPGICLSDGATAVGAQVVASNGTAGAVEDVASTTQAIVGTAITGIATAEFGLVYLTLD